MAVDASLRILQRDASLEPDGRLRNCGPAGPVRDVISAIVMGALVAAAPDGAANNTDSEANVMAQATTVPRNSRPVRLIM